jgi:hypothetical protein
VFEPCAICAKNANEKVNIGTPFPSGDLQPPAHPHCRCALAPVIPGFDEEQLAPGATITTPPAPITSYRLTNEKPTNVREAIRAQLDEAERKKNAVFTPGEWRTVSADEIREQVINAYMVSTGRTRENIEAFIDMKRISKSDLALLDGVVYENGPITVQFYSTGKKIKEETKIACYKTLKNYRWLHQKRNDSYCR